MIAVLAQAASDSTAAFTPWVTGGSALAAVAALAFMGRQFAAGHIMSRDVSELVGHLNEHIERQDDHIERQHLLTAEILLLSERFERREVQLMEYLMNLSGEYEDEDEEDE